MVRILKGVSGIGQNSWSEFLGVQADSVKLSVGGCGVGLNAFRSRQDSARVRRIELGGSGIGGIGQSSFGSGI